MREQDNFPGQDPSLPNGCSERDLDPPPREDDWDEEDERRASEERYEKGTA